MSIQSEIARISGNVSDALDSIAAKGVTVPVGSNSDDLADLIDAIPRAGNVDGILKGDGAGNISAAVPNVDYALPPVASASGSPATFYRSTGGFPVDSLVVDINAVQDGTGNPSPNNVRTISGYSETTVSHSGADTSSPTTETIELGRTVYGGTLNVTTGVLTVTHVLKTYTSTSGWYENGTNCVRRRDTNFMSRSSATGELMCNALQVVNHTVTPANRPEYSICLYPNNYYNIEVKLAQGATSLTSLGTLLSNLSSSGNSLELAAKLDTPQTYQLTPQAISTVFGENNIWADTGDVTVTFGNDIKNYIDAAILNAINNLE